MLFGHLVGMDELADARRILTAVPQSDWKRPTGRPHTSWLATVKNDLSFHNFSFKTPFLSSQMSNVKNIYRQRRMSRVQIGGAGGRRKVRPCRMQQRTVLFLDVP